MKTAFNFLISGGGGRIIFCSILFVFVTDLNSQTTVTFTGNSLFRNYNFGVKNHCFEIKNRYSMIDPLGYANECSSTCPSSYGGTFDASPSQNGNDNDLSVTPYSDNDFDDYINGITVGDAALILKHVNDEEYITDPYKMVAADCNNNGEIDSEDAEQVEDLIGEDILFTRNSWEWFNQKEIIDNYGSFQSDPYSWTISERWSGNIFWLNVSTSTLTSGTTQPQFFYYTSTKVGDVHNQSNPNDWVCGTYCLKEDKDQINSIRFNKSNTSWSIMLPNTIFKLYFKCEKKISDISFFQMPIEIDYNYLRIKKVNACKGLNIKYKLKNAKNEFIAYYINKDRNCTRLLENCSELLSLDLEVIQPISSLSEVLSVNEKRKLEAGNSVIQNLSPYLEIGEIALSENPYSINSGLLYYSGIENQKVEIQIFSLSGQLLNTQKTSVSPGYNELPYLKDIPNYSILRIVDVHNAHLVRIVK